MRVKFSPFSYDNIERSQEGDGCVQSKINARCDCKPLKSCSCTNKRGHTNTGGQREEDNQDSMRRMRGFLLQPRALILMIMIVFLKAQKADSWERKSPTNITVVAGHRCFVADDAADADSFMDPHYLSTMLETPTVSYRPLSDPNIPSVSCPPKEKYTGCLRGEKGAVPLPGQQRCNIFNRDCSR